MLQKKFKTPLYLDWSHQESSGILEKQQIIQWKHNELFGSACL